MKKTILTSVFLSLLLVGCGQDSTSSAHSASSKSTSSQSQKSTASNADFEWSWLANSEATMIEEDGLYKKNYYFILDGSGSMGNPPGSCNRSENSDKIDIAKNAIAQFAQSIPAEDNIGLFAFDGKGINERVPLAVGNREEFNSQLSKVDATVSTPLKTAIKGAYEKVKKQAILQAAHGEHNIIIVTDGEADSGEDPTAIVKEISEHSPVNIYTIGFCIGEGHSLNNKEYVNYYKANNAATIIAGLSEVLAESEEEF
jgi:Mg-chelatase subunit ChlD